MSTPGTKKPNFGFLSTQKIPKKSLTDDLNSALDVFQKAKENLKSIVQSCDSQSTEAQSDMSIAKAEYDAKVSKAKDKIAEADVIRSKVIKSITAMDSILGE